LDNFLWLWLIVIFTLQIWICYQMVYKMGKKNWSDLFKTQLDWWGKDFEINQTKLLQENNQHTKGDIQQFLETIFKIHDGHINDKLDRMSAVLHEQLKTINQRVEQKIFDSHQQSQSVYQNIIKRLAIIDQAQENINKLSDKVVELGDVLDNKQARGLMGEVQLEQIIQNIMPKRCYQMQYTLSNANRVDCILFLPSPTKHLAIDAKFPLEYFKKMQACDRNSPDFKRHQTAFKQSIKKHIKAIADKYILPPETAEGAVMFIPSESIFTVIHNDFPDLVEMAQSHCVWVTSPTTIVAILTTALAVIKDIETRQQVHVIKSHLAQLAKDFVAFDKHITQLSKHIEKAHSGMDQINRTSSKITDKFNKIENVELQELSESTSEDY